MKDYFKIDKHPWGKKSSHILKNNVEFLKKGSVCDLVSGNGRNSIYLARLGFDVTAVGRLDTAIQVFEEVIEEEGI